ncbi:hypothetical protein [Jiangella rhizosphaerae]|uniref:hypothetical protein n=1 Tax=Jiangella rhizosphaerae TaxID=2293569 RepID=UPI001314961D|nr:hypothetical protein [Jiangella rhizosphaerae]
MAQSVPHRARGRHGAHPSGASGYAGDHVGYRPSIDTTSGHESEMTLVQSGADQVVAAAHAGRPGGVP